MIRLGEVEIDPGAHELRHRGVPVTLEPKAFAVLSVLAENGNRLVTKAELIDRVWPGLFVTDASLTSSVRKARAAMGSEAKRLVTVHRRGYRLVLDGDPATDGAAPEVRIFGREAELGELAAALQAARDGAGNLALVCGPGGIGKTYLAREVAHRAGAAYLHLRAACVRFEESPPFHPWAQVLRDYARASGDAAVARVFASRAGDLALIVPDLCPGAAPRESPSALLDGRQDQYRLFDAVAVTLTRAAAAKPLLITLDDIHWADEASLRLLAVVAREIAGAPIFLLATYRRPAETNRYVDDALGQIATESNARTFTLGAIDEQSAARLVQSHAGAEQTSDAWRELYSISEGNPLYLTLLARREEGTTAAGGLPPSLHAIVDVSLRSLPVACWPWLDKAAVVGREFDAEVLAAMAREAETRSSSLAIAAVRSGLGPALAAGIVEATGGDGFRFAHSLFREGIYERIAPAERAGLHLLAGEALEKLEVIDKEQRLAELAWHFGRAAAAGGAAKAVMLHLRAGERASAQLSYEHAAEHFREALACQRSCDRPDPADTAELWIHSSEAEAKRADLVRAREAAENAADIARRIGSATLLARAALASGRPLSAAGEVDPAFVRLLQEAIAAQPPGATVLGARLRSRLAWAYYYAHDRGRMRLAASAEGLEQARQLDDPDTLVWALFERHVALTCPEHGEERLEIANELIERARALGDLELLALGYEARAWDRVAVGRLDEAMCDVAEFAAIGEQLRLPYFQWVHLSWLCMQAAVRGDYDELSSLAARAGRVGSEIDAPLAALASAAAIVFIDLARGRFEVGPPIVRQIVAQFPSLPTPSAVLAYVHAERGDIEAARRECEALRATNLDTLPWDTTWLTAMSFLAVAEARVGDAARCTDLYQRLAPYGDQTSVFGLHASMCFGPVALPLAMLASTLRRWDEAESHFQKAIEVNRRMGAGPWLAYALVAYAEMLCASGRAAGSDVGAIAGEARLLADEIGLEGQQARLARLGF